MGRTTKSPKPPMKEPEYRCIIAKKPKTYKLKAKSYTIKGHFVTIENFSTNKKGRKLPGKLKFLIFVPSDHPPNAYPIAQKPPTRTTGKSIGK